jgi:predicted enzyme related to lactoylglutathione lyase
MPERTAYKHGTPSWVDLTSTNAEAAKAFYTALFGWTSEDMPAGDGIYTMLKKDGKDVAALSQARPDQAGIPSHWNTYVSVDDVDAATRKAADLGGDVHVPAFDVMEAGRMSVVQDPSGAFFCLWQAKNHAGATLVNEPGSLVWNELLTTDVEKAGAFYSALFDWSPNATPTPNGTYYSFMVDDWGMGGMMAIAPEMGPMPSSWLVYFGTDNVDASVTRATELGGKLMMPAMDMPGVGRMALLQDPTGAVFYVITMEKWPER